MKINGTSGGNAQAGSMSTAPLDSVSKSLKQQIANAQKQLQELSANKDMPVEAKMKKRQEIQKQISDLNNQLRQHQMQLRMEKQKAQDSSMKEGLGSAEKNGNNRQNKAGHQDAGLSQAGMKAMISADAAISQAKVQGSVASKMEGKARTLASEIKLDGALGGNTAAKEEELAKIKEKSVNAAAAQVNTLAEANEEIREAAKTENKEEEAKGKKEKETDAGEYGEDKLQPASYTPVDIRL